MLSNNLNKLCVTNSKSSLFLFRLSAQTVDYTVDFKSDLYLALAVQMKVNREMKKAIVGSPLIFTRDALTISAFTDKYEVIKQFPLEIKKCAWKHWWMSYWIIELAVARRHKGIKRNIWGMTCKLGNGQPARGMTWPTKPKREQGNGGGGGDRYRLPRSSGRPAHSNSGAVRV